MKYVVTPSSIESGYCLGCVKQCNGDCSVCIEKG